MERKNINTLLRFFYPAFYWIIFIKMNKESTHFPEKFKELLLDSFNEIENKIRKANFSEEKIVESKYALVALIDESILYSPWSGRVAWMSNSLQLTLFGDHVAGEMFFTRLEKLRQDPVAYKEVLLIYYYCLKFGFLGKYRSKDVGKLNLLEEELYLQLLSISGPIDQQISPNTLIDQNLTKKESRRISFWIMVSILAIAILILYIIYSFLLSYQLHNVLDTISLTKSGR